MFPRQDLGHGIGLRPKHYTQFLEERPKVDWVEAISENFMALGLPWPKGMRIASIGPITSKTVRDQGLTVDIEARRHDIDGLVRAIRELWGC